MVGSWTPSLIHQVPWVECSCSCAGFGTLIKLVSSVGSLLLCCHLQEKGGNGSKVEKNWELLGVCPCNCGHWPVLVSVVACWSVFAHFLPPECEDKSFAPAWWSLVVNLC